MTIRNAMAADTDAIAALESAAFSSGATRAWSPSQVADELALADRAPQRAVVWVEEANTAATAGPIAAWAAFRQIDDEAELLRIAVEPTARRGGIARRLLEHGLQHFGRRGVVRCHLEVADTNTAAIALYESLGFRELGRRTGYYSATGNGTARADALLLSRPLRGRCATPRDRHCGPTPRC